MRDQSGVEGKCNSKIYYLTFFLVEKLLPFSCHKMSKSYQTFVESVKVRPHSDLPELSSSYEIPKPTSSLALFPKASPILATQSK